MTTAHLLTLPVLSREQAAAQGYGPISYVFDPTEEPGIAASMEKSMKGVDAVWISQVHGYRTVVELGRKRTELRRETESH
jgi:hypothetical protein